jgi:hypothetical protein
MEMRSAMTQMKCPACGSESFYTKDPDDQYNIFEFSLKEGRIIFNPEDTESTQPDIVEETETFCQRCAWHDKFKTLNRG